MTREIEIKNNEGVKMKKDKLQINCEENKK